jgi:elongator complex protein 1
VPPPMSSAQLSFPTPSSLTNAPTPQSRLPVYTTFSPAKDVLANLWETGYIQLTDLRTRLGPGRGKIMDPQELWKGMVGVEASEYRQAMVLQDASVRDGATEIAVLGSGKERDATDSIILTSISDTGASESVDIQLPQRNGRLVVSDRQAWWQSPEGEILQGMFIFSCRHQLT